MMMLKHFPFFDFELGFGIEFFFLNSFNKSFAKIISLLENLQTKVPIEDNQADFSSRNRIILKIAFSR